MRTIQRHPTRIFLAGAALFVACGGQSIRHEDGDNGSGGEAAEPASGRGGGSNDGGTSGTSAGGTSDGGATGARPSVGGTGTAGSYTGGDGGTTSTGGSGIGAAGTGAVAGQCSGMRPEPPLYWDDFGRIDSASNGIGIQGSWYSYDDCNAASSFNVPCTWRDPSLTAYNGELGWTTLPGAACARGTAPRVELGPDGAPLWSVQWGFGIGFPLNDGLAYDAKARCIDGLAFDIGGIAPVAIRVQLTTTTTLNEPYFVDIAVRSGSNELFFSDFRQGGWVTAPQPFDPTRLTNMQFFVYTSDTATTPFDFCISNVRMIPEALAE